MERISDMLDYLKDDIQQRLTVWEQELLVVDHMQIKKILEIFKAKIETEETCMVITYLRSSYITHTHQFKIALYENEPFMSGAIAHRFIDLTPLYKGLPDSIDAFIMKIKSQFIRVLPYEVEEIRRFYIDYLYQNSCFFFKSIVSEIANNEASHDVYFGEEIGKVEHIGVV